MISFFFKWYNILSLKNSWNYSGLVSLTNFLVDICSYIYNCILTLTTTAEEKKYLVWSRRLRYYGYLIHSLFNSFYKLYTFISLYRITQAMLKTAVLHNYKWIQISVNIYILCMHIAWIYISIHAQDIEYHAEIWMSNFQF